LANEAGKHKYLGKNNARYFIVCGERWTQKLKNVYNASGLFHHFQNPSDCGQSVLN
jgi:hypothetical protein